MSLLSSRISRKESEKTRKDTLILRQQVLEPKPIPGSCFKGGNREKKFGAGNANLDRMPDGAFS